jgi:hypothetical protein
MENNTFTFWVTTDRVPFLLVEMPGKAKVIGDEEDGTTKMQVSIDNGTDALLLFHAGIKCGVAAFVK